MHLDLGPYTQARGTVQLPGSKSISNRVLLLAALAHGKTLITNLLEADDTRVMLEALATLGVHCLRQDQGYAVAGVGGVFPLRKAQLFLGNAGTAVRLLSAALALQAGESDSAYQISGVPRMHERPIGDLVDSLRVLGASIEYSGREGFPPLMIGPMQKRHEAVAGKADPATSIIAPHQQLAVRGDVSSQFLSAVLMALPLLPAAQRSVIIKVDGELISKPYIDLTISLMARFGVQVEREGWQRFTLAAGSSYQAPGQIAVEGDASSASYFLAAGAIGGGPLRVTGVGAESIQGDIGFANVLTEMGANVMMGPDWIEVSGVTNSPRRLKAIDMDFNLIPDAAMTVAVLALFAEGTSTLRNIASWRVKETDRLAAMATELRKLGATVDAGADFLRITPPATLTAGAEINTYDDHRMAMCFSLVSLAGVPIKINDPNCVAKTFPDYFERFGAVVR
ncbi:3-phosphoshikimate 1-carboxyvinyltransferase [Mycoavidus sp. HKI]|uniref:3-phosphoshikimate 1-carboxyvinyltransferase n=1 Tax=Mycoavidus sp. HKI TaxID=2840467 RepID=UPI001CBAB8E2|nr:3-phosphoshikimate 1-carboxyvinyltransferase [Mycoavidus sp. HKI]UAW63693.1 3-phosphoshikimate 1-carboxyvinyltransferase [Mycoavidus sp. HKI]